MQFVVVKLNLYRESKNIISSHTLRVRKIRVWLENVMWNFFRNHGAKKAKKETVPLCYLSIALVCVVFDYTVLVYVYMTSLLALC